MYYLDIVNLFDIIDDVTVQTSKKSITVYGRKDGELTTYSNSYQHLKVAQEVAKRLKYFIGIEKN